jgi:hypothetical protein
MGYCKPFKRGASWRSQNFGANATIYGPHSGNDDAAPIGTPVHAAGDGYIDWAGEFDDTYQDNLLWLLKMGGNILVLNCGANAPSFVYGHLDSFTVKRGDWVRKGQVIAYSGNTGTATTGAHLHTEAIPPGYALNSSMLGRVNPDIYLTEWPEDLNVGSLSYASESITPAQEDDMPLTKEDVDNIAARIVEVIQPIEDVTRQYLADRTRDAAIAVLNGSQAQEDVTRQYLVDTTQAQSDVTRQFLSDRIKETAPADLAVQINAAGLAEAVRDELVKLIGGE